VSTYEVYFTDFTGKIFNFNMNHDGYATIPDDLFTYLDMNYGIHRLKFTPSRPFIFAKCASNIINYVDNEVSTETMFSSHYHSSNILHTAYCISSIVDMILTRNWFTL
jgi:hypothetical protein